MQVRSSFVFRGSYILVLVIHLGHTLFVLNALTLSIRLTKRGRLLEFCFVLKVDKKGEIVRFCVLSP